MSCELKSARTLANAYWYSYMNETDPMKRAMYGERYAYWAEYRDQLEASDNGDDA